MHSYNKTTILGFLATDPELTTLPSGSQVCNSNIATNETWKTASGDYASEPMFIAITIFGARGVAFSKLLKKGNPVLIDGSLRYNTWDDKATGQKRSRHYILVSEFRALAKNDTEPYKKCTLDTDGDGNCPVHPQGCPKSPTQAYYAPGPIDDVPF